MIDAPEEKNEKKEDARVGDTQYAEPLATASKNEAIPTMGLCVIRTDRGLFWGPKRGGYCRDVEDAGLYTEAEARRLAGDLRCGQLVRDEVLPADSFCMFLQARADRITEFLVAVALARADDAVDPYVTDTGKPSTRDVKS